jgi:hypothetical protein
VNMKIKSRRLQTFKMPTNTSSFLGLKHNLSFCSLGFTCFTHFQVQNFGGSLN